MVGVVSEAAGGRDAWDDNTDAGWVAGGNVLGGGVGDGGALGGDEASVPIDGGAVFGDVSDGGGGGFGGIFGGIVFGGDDPGGGKPGSDAPERGGAEVGDTLVCLRSFHACEMGSKSRVKQLQTSQSTNSKPIICPWNH